MEVLVCPKCASSKIDFGELIGGGVNVGCSNCGWVGKRRDMLQSGTAASPLEIAEKISLEYMRLLAKYTANIMGRAMVQAGIVGAKDPERLARLIKAACHGAHRATLEEVEKMQKELLDERHS